MLHWNSRGSSTGPGAERGGCGASVEWAGSGEGTCCVLCEEQPSQGARKGTILRRTTHPD